MARESHVTVADLAALLSSRDIVVAVTDIGTDPRYSAIRTTATSIAALANAKVVLFHEPRDQRDPTTRPWRFFDHAPRPESVEGTGSGSSPRRDELRRQAGSIRGAGVDVAVWVTDRPIGAGLAEAVAEIGARLVLMPAETNTPGIVRRTLEYRAARVAATVVAVDSLGRCTFITPLGTQPPAHPSTPARTSGVRSLRPEAAGASQRQR